MNLGKMKCPVCNCFRNSKEHKARKCKQVRTVPSTSGVPPTRYSSGANGAFFSKL